MSKEITRSPHLCSKTLKSSVILKNQWNSRAVRKKIKLISSEQYDTGSILVFREKEELKLWEEVVTSSFI